MTLWTVTHQAPLLIFNINNVYSIDIIKSLAISWYVSLQPLSPPQRLQGGVEISDPLTRSLRLVLNRKMTWHVKRLTLAVASWLGYKGCGWKKEMNSEAISPIQCSHQWQWFSNDSRIRDGDKRLGSVYILKIDPTVFGETLAGREERSQRWLCGLGPEKQEEWSSHLLKWAKQQVEQVWEGKRRGLVPDFSFETLLRIQVEMPIRLLDTQTWSSKNRSGVEYESCQCMDSI